MIITKSNVISATIPTVTTGVSTDLPDNLINEDFSLNYTSSQSTLVAEYGAVGDINYVAVCAKDFGRQGNGHVRVYDGTTIIATINTTNDQVVVVSFDSQSFSNLRIAVASNSTDKPTVYYMAAGVAFTVPNNGENAGYNRQFLSRNYEVKTRINNEAVPVSSLYRKKQARGRLNLQNIAKDFTEGEWQDFLDFAYSSLFFIKEQDDVVINASSGTNKSAYLCYDPSNDKVTAHPQTRALNNISIGFKVFNGL